MFIGSVITVSPPAYSSGTTLITCIDTVAPSSTIVVSGLSFSMSVTYPVPSPDATSA